MRGSGRLVWRTITDAGAARWRQAEIKKKTAEALTNKGGGAAGLADRKGGAAGHAKYKCPVCGQAAPDLKARGRARSRCTAGA